MGPAVIGVSAAQISALINTQLAALLGDGAHLVDHVRRPADGVSERAARRGARHDPAAVAREASQRRRSRRSTRRCSTGACGSRSCSRCRRRSRCGCWRCRWSPRSTSTASSASTTCGRRAPHCWATASGLLALILVKILAPGFYARQDMRTPVKIAFLTVLITQALAMLSCMAARARARRPHARDEPRRVRERGAAVLVPAQARLSTQPQPGWLAFLAKLVVALGVLGAVLVLARRARRSSGSNAGLWAKVGRLSASHRRRRGRLFRRALLLGFRFADFNRRDTSASRGIVRSGALAALAGAGSAASCSRRTDTARAR